MQMIGRVTLGAALSILLATLAHTAAAAPTKSLYKRLGGKAAVTAVVNEFVIRVAADSRINKFFARADVAHLKIELVDLICQGSGGPCKYSGKSMRDAHRGMGVSGADFNALVDDLVGALDKFKVPEREKKDLLALLGPMKTDIVER